MAPLEIRKAERKFNKTQHQLDEMESARIVASQSSRNAVSHDDLMNPPIKLPPVAPTLSPAAIARENKAKLETLDKDLAVAKATGKVEATVEAKVKAAKAAEVSPVVAGVVVPPVNAPAWQPNS